MKDYSECELQNLWGFKTFSNLFIVVVYMSYLVAIEASTHVGSATASFTDLVTVSHKSENPTKQTAELSAGHSGALLNYKTAAHVLA